MFELDPQGLRILKRTLGEPTTLELDQSIQQEIDEEEMRRAIHPPHL